MSTQTVELYVDPLCPWCWLTSRWLFEAERIRPVEVVTRLFSLAEVNRAEDHERDALNAGERALRVLAAVRRSGGEVAIRAAYTQIGEAHHERDEPLGETATLERALSAASLDPALVEAALADPTTLTELLAEHAAAAERGAFGVASLSIDGGPLVFGPVVDTRIVGEAAGELWDVVAPLLANPRVFELKRRRTTRADVGRNRLRDAASRSAA